jgi:hypothetical protein
MPRHPTGNPRGRPKGTGRLTPNQTIEDAQTRVTVRLPIRLYDRLEAFAAGRHFHRDSPQLARCIREALEEYLERHTKRQTENITTPRFDINRQTVNGILVSDVVTPGAEDNNRQTVNIPMALEKHIDIISQPVIEQEEPDTTSVPLDAADLEAIPFEPDNASVALLPQPDHEPNGREALPRATVDTPQQTAQTALAYDPTKYTLGKLCPRGHDYQGTGQTLLTLRKRRCLPCEAAKKRERR